MQVEYSWHSIRFNTFACVMHCCEKRLEAMVLLQILPARGMRRGDTDVLREISRKSSSKNGIVEDNCTA